MGDVFPEITPKLREWIEAQRVFFVATAPAGASGRVNLSPKGADSLRVTALPHDRLRAALAKYNRLAGQNASP